MERWQLPFHFHIQMLNEQGNEIQRKGYYRKQMAICLEIRCMHFRRIPGIQFAVIVRQVTGHLSVTGIIAIGKGAIKWAVIHTKTRVVYT